MGISDTLGLKLSGNDYEFTYKDIHAINNELFIQKKMGMVLDDGSEDSFEFSVANRNCATMENGKLVAPDDKNTEYWNIRCYEDNSKNTTNEIGDAIEAFEISARKIWTPAKQRAAKWARELKAEKKRKELKAEKKRKELEAEKKRKELKAEKRRKAFSARKIETPAQQRAAVWARELEAEKELEASA